MNPYESKFILSDKKVKVIITILGLIAIVIIGVFHYAKFDVGTKIITNIKSSKAQREVAKKLGGVSVDNAKEKTQEEIDTIVAKVEEDTASIYNQVLAGSTLVNKDGNEYSFLSNGTMAGGRNYKVEENGGYTLTIGDNEVYSMMFTEDGEVILTDCTTNEEEVLSFK